MAAIGVGAAGIGLTAKLEIKVEGAASGLDGLTAIEVEAAGIGLTAKIEVKVGGAAPGLDGLIATELEATGIGLVAKVEVELAAGALGLDGLTENIAVEGVGIAGGLIENVNILPGAEGPATGARKAEEIG